MSVYYQLGGGYADIINKYVNGYKMRSEPTGNSDENIMRVDSGDMDLAFSCADAAADAVRGKGVFLGKPQRIVALARLYDNIAQVVVRSSAKARSLADLRGKRVSTSTPHSTTDVIAGRMIEAVGLDPDKDMTRLRWSLAETVKGMKDGTVDAFFQISEIPTTEITNLFDSSPGQFTFLQPVNVIKGMNEKYGDIYQGTVIAKSMYKTLDDIPTLAVPNILIASSNIPESLAYKIIKALFEHQSEIVVSYSDGGNLARTNAKMTEPIPLHPGARRFYEQG